MAVVTYRQSENELLSTGPFRKGRREGQDAHRARKRIAGRRRGFALGLRWPLLVEYARGETPCFALCVLRGVCGGGLWVSVEAESKERVGVVEEMS